MRSPRFSDGSGVVRARAGPLLPPPALAGGLTIDLTSSGMAGDIHTASRASGSGSNSGSRSPRSVSATMTSGRLPFSDGSNHSSTSSHTKVGHTAMLPQTLGKRYPYLLDPRGFTAAPVARSMAHLSGLGDH